MPVRVQRMFEDSWERVRSVRLRSLADTPDAFGMTLIEEEGTSSAEWKDRCARIEVATFVAVRNELDVGFVVGKEYAEPERYRPDERVAGLFGMWVDPAGRGQGIGSLLVDAVIAWARNNSYSRIALDVGDFNEPAIRLYERKGFVPTGRVGTLEPPRQHIVEHERVLALK